MGGNSDETRRAELIRSLERINREIEIMQRIDHPGDGTLYL